MKVCDEYDIIALIFVNGLNYCEYSYIYCVLLKLCLFVYSVLVYDNICFSFYLFRVCLFEN